MFELKKINLKQGSLAWEKLREKHIGSSEVFDIVRYYATVQELQNCGLNPEQVQEEEPYTTAWALYHKMINDGLFKREALAPALAEYGHAIEPYGVYKLGVNRHSKLKPSQVYISDKLVASLDIEGIAEECDLVPFVIGEGKPKIGQRFVCEQKSIMPVRYKKGLPIKHIIQAQYQVMTTKADFYILQLVILDEDSEFIRGRICQMSKKKKFEYLDNNARVETLYFTNNIALGELIKVCLERFFKDVSEFNEPMPFLPFDSQKNILTSIRANSFFNADMVLECDLQKYLGSKQAEEIAKERRIDSLQAIIEDAKEFNASRFKDPVTGHTAKFSKAGAFLVTEPKEV